MKYFRVLLCFVLVGFGVSLFSGCNRGPQLPPGLPKLTLTRLTFTQEGKPLSGATVTLIDQEGSQSWYPGGLTNDNGEVELYTNGKYKGAPSGKYKITVKKIYTEPSKHGPPLEEGAPGYEEWQKKTAKEVLKSYSVVDKKFGDAQTSSLEISIPGGTTAFDVGKAVQDTYEEM